MKTKAILVMMFVVAGFVVPGWADFRTVGIYDPTDLYFPELNTWGNDVDQGGAFSSATGGAGAGNVILWAEYTSTFKAEIDAAWGNNIGGVIDLEGSGDSLDGQTIHAIYGTSGNKTLDITNIANNNMSRGTGQEKRRPVSGNYRFNKGDGSAAFDFVMGNITGGSEGEKVIKFGGTLLERNDRAMGFTAIAYFSDGSTVTATAGTSESVPSDEDTFFGFVAPEDEYITRVLFWSRWTHIDELFFITDDDFPPASGAGDDQTVQLHDALVTGRIAMDGTVSNSNPNDTTHIYAWTCVPAAGVVITNADDEDPNVTFPSAGSYVLTLNVTGIPISGPLDPDSVTITVVKSVSNAGDNQTVQLYDADLGTGSGVTLAGSVNNPYDGFEGTEVYTDYDWSGGFVGGTTTGATPTVSFTSTGDHIVTLIVDGDVQDPLAPDTVRIRVIAPTLDIGDDQRVGISEAMTRGVKMDAIVNDPYDGLAGTENYTYVWTCNPTLDPGDYDPDNTALNPVVKFPSKGDYVLTLAVTGGAPANSTIPSDDVTVSVMKDFVLVAHFAIDAGELAAGAYLDHSTEGDPNNNHTYITVSMGQVAELSNVSNGDEESEDAPVGCDEFGAADMDISMDDPNGVELYLDHDPNVFNADGPHLDNIANAVTVALWVNLDNHSSSTNHCLVDKSGSFRFSVDDAGYLKTFLWVDGRGEPNQINSKDGDLGQNLDNENLAIDQEEWHHIAFTYDSYTGMVYQFIDGAEVRSTDIGAGLLLNINTNHLYLGFEADGSNHTDGEFDDIRIYNYELDPYEIVELASMGDSSAMIYAGSNAGTINPSTLPYQLNGQYIQLGQGVNKVSRDEPGEFFFEWDQTSGPGILSPSDPNQYQAIFSDAGDPEGYVSFVAPGDYTLRFRARERYCGGDIKVSDRMTITIDDPSDALGSILLGGANNVANIAGNDSVVSLPDLAALAADWGSSAP